MKNNDKPQPMCNINSLTKLVAGRPWKWVFSEWEDAYNKLSFKGEEV